MTGRCVIVTGGSRGLGLGIGRKLRDSGYSVVAIARQPTDALDAAMREESPGSVAFRPCDLGDLDGIPKMVRELRREFGTIWGLVNNAALGTSGLLATMRDAQIEQLVRLNTVSPLILTKYVVRSMMAGGGGRVVNIASIVGFTGYSGLAAYSATKAAMLGFTRSLAREVGPLGVTVNAIAPGFVDTEMTHEMQGQQRERVVRRSALKRLAEIDDIAEAVEFLIGDKAKNITGTTMTIDAGSTA